MKPELALAGLRFFQYLSEAGILISAFLAFDVFETRFRFFQAHTVVAILTLLHHSVSILFLQKMSAKKANVSMLLDLISGLFFLVTSGHCANAASTCMRVLGDGSWSSAMQSDLCSRFATITVLGMV